MRAIVTGGAGFIGSHLADALVENGDDVLVVDDLSTGKRSNIPHEAEFDWADIRNPLERIFERFDPDVVFHLAAQIDVRRSVADPAFDADVNVIGTIRVVEAARKVDAQVIFASSGGGVYGEGAFVRLPFTEHHDAVPISPYGQSKLAAESYVFMAGGISLRLSNVYGPGQDASGECGVIAIFTRQRRDRERPTVYGDGSQTRDYVHVSDVVVAMIAAAESDLAGGWVLNIGTGIETSVSELAELLRLDPDFSDRRSGEVERTALDLSQATEFLGWEPAVTLAEGLLEL